MRPRLAVGAGPRLEAMTSACLIVVAGDCAVSLVVEAGATLEATNNFRHNRIHIMYN